MLQDSKSVYKRARSGASLACMDGMVKRYEYFLWPFCRCRALFIQIYDGRSTQDRRISNLCGRELPQPVMSSGGRVTLVFKTDSSISHSGFAFRFFFCGECFLYRSTPVSRFKLFVLYRVLSTMRTRMFAFQVSGDL